MAKAVSFQTTNQETTRIGYYSKKVKATQASFFRDAAHEKCDRIKAEEAGGAFIFIPMPKQSQKLKDFVRFLNCMHKALQTANCGHTDALDDLLEFYTRALDYTPGKRKLLEAQALIDQEFEDSLAEEENDHDAATSRQSN
jgi:hypothetical protein